MAEVINMPRLSDTMEEGTVATWLKNVGDKVEEGDILAEIETDKATMEFESFYDGYLLYIGVQEGDTTKVDELLAIIGKKGEDISSLLNNSSSQNKIDTKKDTEDAEKPVQKPTKKAELPKGVKVVTMPRLSDTMEEGTVANWLKSVGDEVEEGEILAEIETDKATMEFESFNEGVLLHIGVNEGESAKVDALLAVIGPKGTDISSVVENYTTYSSEKSDNDVSENVESSSFEQKNNSSKVATSNTTIKAVAKTFSNNRVLASPLAKKMAEDKGFNLSEISGSGENGRIVKRDIENFKGVKANSNKAELFVASGQEEVSDIKHSSMRKAIAKRLSQSKFTAPHYYLNVEFNMDNAIAFRKQVNALPNTKISFNDIIVKACALALKKHPQVNSQWFDDKIKLNHHVHIGVAVAVEDGLVVPVVRFTNEKSFVQIGSEVKDFAGRAKTKKLTPQEIEGSTFTISNLGMFGIESFTSIINQPNSAILSVGAIVQKPIVKDGVIVVGNTMKLTMACDHRTVDGATGAQFLQTLKMYIENPMAMLI